MRFVNCRYCSSIGAENLCSTCSLNGEHESLPLIKEIKKSPKGRKLTAKQLAAQEAFLFVKSLKDEDIDY